MRVELVVNTKSGKERVFVLEGYDIFLIGRSRNAHLPLRGDLGLSRHHCVTLARAPRVRPAGPWQQERNRRERPAG
ncbi:MAG: hypothetical protein HY720_31620 [Planctomycetes bacterium]|nr:hypothetical protein [Planctomycetota bacterium]